MNFSSVLALSLSLYSGLAFAGLCSSEQYDRFVKMDTNGDGRIHPIEELNSAGRVISVLNGRLSPTPQERQRLDANDDGRVTALDALLFTNFASFIGRGTPSPGVALDAPGCSISKLRAFSVLVGASRAANVPWQTAYASYFAAYFNDDGAPDLFFRLAPVLDFNLDGRVNHIDAAIIWEAYSRR